MVNESEIKKSFSRWRVLIPVLIGLGVAVYFIYGAVTQVEFIKTEKGQGEYSWKDANNNGIVDFTSEEEFIADPKSGEYKKQSFSEAAGEVNWTWFSTFCIFMALLMMVVRDAMYMWRIKILTDNQLSWRQSFNVIMIWEFASAMTPGVVGGAAVAMFILNREKINMGKSTALVMITALLDELFYIIAVPVMLLIVGTSQLFPVDLTKNLFGTEFHIQGLFWLGFGIITFITLLLFTGVFISPKTFKSVLLFFCRLPFLKRLRQKAEKTGDDIIVTSKELKGKPASFWTKAFIATALSWTGRFLVINFIIMAFSPWADQFTIFARQLSMWVILIISPTPGGSGIAEFVFSGFLEEFIAFGLVGILAVLWRLISYYPYLLIGAIVLPGWLGKHRK